MPLSDDDVREILRIVDESSVAELVVETDGFSLRVVRGAGAGDSPPPATVSSAAEQANGLVVIESPMLGTFYRAEAPGKPPFVEVGSRVEPDTTVCIIEVMKMMNSVPAGVSGTVTAVIADNAELVEYGAPLFRVKPE